MKSWGMLIYVIVVRSGDGYEAKWRVISDVKVMMMIDIYGPISP
jgi:hypothetical protein